MASTPYIYTNERLTCSVAPIFFFSKHFIIILCIQSNHKQLSLFQGTELYQNVGGGIILTEQSLVLQSVTRASAGDYTCLAANTEGKGTSNPVTLRVRCK